MCLGLARQAAEDAVICVLPERPAWFWIVSERDQAEAFLVCLVGWLGFFFFTQCMGEGRGRAE